MSISKIIMAIEVRKNLLSENSNLNYQYTKKAT